MHTASSLQLWDFADEETGLEMSAEQCGRCFVAREADGQLQDSVHIQNVGFGKMGDF